MSLVEVSLASWQMAARLYEADNTLDYTTRSLIALYTYRFGTWSPEDAASRFNQSQEELGITKQPSFNGNAVECLAANSRHGLASGWDQAAMYALGVKRVVLSALTRSHPWPGCLYVTLKALTAQGNNNAQLLYDHDDTDRKAYWERYQERVQARSKFGRLTLLPALAAYKTPETSADCRRDNPQSLIENVDDWISTGTAPSIAVQLAIARALGLDSIVNRRFMNRYGWPGWLGRVLCEGGLVVSPDMVKHEDSLYIHPFRRAFEASTGKTWSTYRAAAWLNAQLNRTCDTFDAFPIEQPISLACLTDYIAGRSTPSLDRQLSMARALKKWKVDRAFIGRHGWPGWLDVDPDNEFGDKATKHVNQVSDLLVATHGCMLSRLAIRNLLLDSYAQL